MLEKLHFTVLASNSRVLYIKPPKTYFTPMLHQSGNGEDLFCTCITYEPHSRETSRSNEMASTSLVPRPLPRCYLAAMDKIWWRPGKETDIGLDAFSCIYPP